MLRRIDYFIDSNAEEVIQKMIHERYTDSGRFVLHEEAQQEIDGLVEALRQLRLANINHNLPGDLNEFITRVLVAYGHE